MYSWLWLLWLFTCWSWGPGAQWCGPLGPCRALRGHNPLMSVAPRSCPSSSETGTWYQSCRCQITVDLKVERCLCYWSAGSVKLFPSPEGDRRSPPPSRCQGLRSATEEHPLFLRGFQCPAQRHSSRVDVCFHWAIPAEEQLPCNPAAGVPIVSLPKRTANKDKPFLPFLDEALWLAWPIFLSGYQQGSFSPHFTWES